MAQAYTSDRIIFKNGDQSEFILACKAKLCVTWVSMSKIVGVNCRTLRDWSKGKMRMSYDSALILSEKSNIDLPPKTEIVRWVNHMREISVKGGKACRDKYGAIGNEMVRQVAWRTWWNEKGKFRDIEIFRRKEIKIPNRNSFLAEFVGIMIGDGCITNYTIKITLDTVSDKEYIIYVTKLLKYLFNVDPIIYKHTRARATDVIIQRKNLVDFCISIGLKIGNKIRQNIDIPNWIKNDQEFSVACLRGLIDTDGCFFNHSYYVNGKKYNYTKIAFTCRCPLVVKSVEKFLIKLRFRVRISKDGNDVRIENQKDVLRYMDIIGTSNPKFKKKIEWRRVRVVE